MIKVLGMVRSASGAVLIAHTVKTVFALALLGGFGRDLTGVAGGGDWVEIARFALQDGRRYSAGMQWVALSYVLVGPLLTQYVLAALVGRERPARAARQRYWAALALSLFRLALLALTIAVALALAAVFAARVTPELETGARVAPLVLGGALLAWLLAAFDLAAAQLAVDYRPRIASALGTGVRASAGLALLHLACASGVAVTYALGEAASRAAWPALGFAAAQACALAAAFVNAAWLSAALTRTSQPFRASQQ